MVGRHRKKIGTAPCLGVSCRYMGAPAPTSHETTNNNSWNWLGPNREKSSGHGEGRSSDESRANRRSMLSSKNDGMITAKREIGVRASICRAKGTRDVLSSVGFEHEGRGSDGSKANWRSTLSAENGVLNTAKRDIVVRASVCRDKGFRDVLSVEFDEEVCMKTGGGDADLRLAEGAALYGLSTQRYVRALDDENEDAARTLAQIHREFEERQVQLFDQFQSDNERRRAAHDEDSLAEVSTSLDSVLGASYDLLTETALLWDSKQKKKALFAMPPRVVPHRAVDLAWTAAVAHICVRRVWHQIGGSDGRRLPILTVAELLDVIAWSEHFQDTLQRIDAEVSPGSRGPEQRTARVDASSQPRLFAGDAEGATEEDAHDSLVWVRAAAEGLNLKSRDELVIRSTMQTLEWASKAYKTEHVVHQARDGRLFTSLPEDIFSPMTIQLRTICDRLPLSSDALPTVIAGILSTLRQVHLREGEGRLSDFERRCAAANDFERMGEEWESFVSEILRDCFPHLGGEQDQDDGVMMKSRLAIKESLEAVSSELVHTFMSDAVKAAESVILPVFDPIQKALGSELFGLEWEDNWTQNELARTLTATVEDFLGDLRQFLGEYMLAKATRALVSASVVFYIEYLLKKGGGRGDVAASSFMNNRRALLRIAGDIDVMRGYFEALEMPSLGRTIEEEFKVLTAIHELLSIAAGISSSEACDFILLLHKRIRDVHTMKQILKDIWHLVSPKKDRTILKTISAMESQVLATMPDEAKAFAEKEGPQMPGTNLDVMVEGLYSVNGMLMSKRGEKVARGRARFPSLFKKEPCRTPRSRDTQQKRVTADKHESGITEF